MRNIHLLPALAAASIWLQAQQPPPNVDAMRAQRQQARATVLDKAQSPQARTAAIQQLGYPDDATFAALLGIGKDSSEPSPVRAAALHRHKFDESYFEAVLKILDDPNDGDEELDTKLIHELGQRITFRMPATFIQRYQSALRKLLDDTRPRVRLQAYRVLVASHDTTAIGRLSDSLRTRSNIPIPTAEAINLLNEDAPVNHIAVVRPYLEDPDPAIRAQAARLLAADGQSRAKVAEIARNSQSPIEVRLLAIRALAREDQSFPEYATALVSNQRENFRIRQAAMQAMAGRMNYKQVDARVQVRFAAAVKRLANEARADKAVQKEAAELHAYLVKAFPAVRQAQ